MNSDVLVIVAAGKSSRFGGFPKAFCKLGDETNIQNTIRLAKPFYDKIYVVLNKEIVAKGYAENLNAEVISIVTGQGDADSLLKAIRIIRQNDKEVITVTACWGDAVFIDDLPFKEMNSHISMWNKMSPSIVGCSMDEEPYAWFDTEHSKIVRSHFKKDGEICSVGLHDQSIFAFNIKLLVEYLEKFKKHLGLDIYSEDSFDIARGEMKLLDSFAFFNDMPEMNSAEYRIITKNKVKSFNTAEELQTIIDEI